MQNWRIIDKHRLSIFTDAIMAIIMTLLVLDLKVPIGNIISDADLEKQLLKQVPHFIGFVVSFSMIVIIWFSHHSLIASIKEATNTFAMMNFIFSGAIATLPFSTALVSEYPMHSAAVAILAGNMLLMNLFLTGMFIYAEAQKILIPDARPDWYSQIKKKMGIAGMYILLLSVFIAFFSTKFAIALIIFVPLMHCIPVTYLVKPK